MIYLLACMQMEQASVTVTAITGIYLHLPGICIVIINFFIIIFWRLLQFQIISIMVNVKKIKKTMWVDRLQFLIQLINYLA